MRETLILFGTSTQSELPQSTSAIALSSLSFSLAFALYRSSFILAQQYIRETRGISSFQVPATSPSSENLYAMRSRVRNPRYP